MLLPIDLVIVIIYWSMTAPDPGSAAVPFKQVWLPVLVVALLVLLAGEIGAQMVAGFIRRRGLYAAPAQTLVKMANNVFRAFLVLVYIFQLRQLNWPGSLVLIESEMLNSIIGLSPHFLTLILSWPSFFRLANLVRPGQWTWKSYMLHRLRYNFFIFIPWLCLWSLVDLAGWLAPALGVAVPGESSWLEPLAMLPLLFVAVLIFPWILVRLWGCKPLENARLLRRLDEVQERAGIRFSRVWLWNLGGGTILNAAVLGFIKPCRYLLLSKGLLHHLTENEISAVVGHELGHVHHRHLWWYLLITGAFLLGMGTFMSWWLVENHLVAIGIALSLGLYIRFIFGFMSRNFERQADLYAAVTLGMSDGLISSLEKIAYISGNVRKARCWHHASIAERVEFLRSVQENPALAEKHDKYCFRMRQTLGSLAVAVIITVVILAGDFMGASPAKGQNNWDYPEFEHWQRVMQVVKDDPEAPKQLARLASAGLAPEAARTSEALVDYRREAEERSGP
ncbi:MAG: M48 family metalloprotease [Planctomycetes bacterium]|nr:M48 family metalloprotease [Planctomycetota bacterium]